MSNPSRRRDDFTQAVKEVLAKRVGYLCSNPNCRAHTVGPASEHSRAANIGTAAHITAASPGGPRYDANLTPEERRGAENGIWCCQNCGHLIDTDQHGYSVETLRSWKADAEKRAAQSIRATPPGGTELSVTKSLDIQLVVDGVGRFFTGGGDLRKALLEGNDEETRADGDRLRNQTATDRARSAMQAQILGLEPPGPPPSPDELEEFITERRLRVERDWERIEDYVAGIAWPPLRFVITNLTPCFLRDVKLIITFVGAHGVAKEDLDAFQVQKLLDPDYERARSMFDPAPPLTVSKPDGYPVAWKNVESGLEVRITLAELPPGDAFAWDSEEYEDVVLVAQSSDRSVRVTWQAVAPGHGLPVHGTEIELRVEGVPIIEEVARLLE
jgi:hypothetical protein